MTPKQRIINALSFRMADIVIDTAKMGETPANASAAIELALTRINPSLPGEVAAHFRSKVEGKQSPLNALRCALAAAIRKYGIARPASERPLQGLGNGEGTDWVGLVVALTDGAKDMAETILTDRERRRQQEIDAAEAERQHQLAMQRIEQEREAAELARQEAERGNSTAVNEYERDSDIPKDNTMLFAGIGVVGILLVGGMIFFAVRKK